MKAYANKQRGVGMAGIIFIIAAVLFVAILGMKVVPAYLHSIQIQRIFKVIVNDPEMQVATTKEILDSYSKRATMDFINDISAGDIEVVKDSGSFSLSTSYSVKVPVAGNMSLLLEFNPSATK